MKNYEVIILVALIGYFIYTQNCKKNNQLNENFEDVIGANFEIY
jgi:hypothetical protein